MNPESRSAFPWEPSFDRARAGDSSEIALIPEDMWTSMCTSMSIDECEAWIQYWDKEVKETKEFARGLAEIARMYGDEQ